MAEFSFINAILGGSLFGLTAGLLFWLNGRIAGFSGILGELLLPRHKEWIWRLMFVTGAILGGIVLQTLKPEVFAIQVDRSLPIFILAGLLIGFGARMEQGCTSGHGICGVGRVSRRSILALFTFAATGSVVVFIINKGLGGAL